MEKIKSHERLFFGVLLAATAGGLDSYTYLVHGEVFAGLQTGNFILLGIHLGQGDIAILFRYLVPIFAFAFGAGLARWLQYQIKKRQQIFFLLIEIFLLGLVGLFSSVFPDLLSNALLSITAAFQLQEFQKLKGTPFTSLMMTGNLRNLATSFFEGYFKNDLVKRAAFRDTSLILLSFMSGAFLNGFLVNYLHTHTIFISALFLLIALSTLLKEIRSH